MAPAPAPIAVERPPHAPDPSLFAEPPKPLLAIDWKTVSLATDADAEAVWQQIAPTGADWEAKLAEVPEAAERPLSLALLHGGNFACAAPTGGACARAALDIPSPAEAAGLADPCLRRVLALWALDQLDAADVPSVAAALDAIAALPPPESQLIAAALHAVLEADQDRRLALLAIAWRAGQRELVNGTLGAFDEAHLKRAITEVHIDGALEILSAQAHRAVYVAAIRDEALGGAARGKAIDELVAGDDKLAPDVRAALVAVTKSADCSVAAAAARALEVRGDKRYVPRRPATNSIPQLMRGLCVLASYESLQRSDEASLLPTYLPPRGLERFTFTEDPTIDDAQKAELVARADAVLPEIEDLVRAMRHCAGTVCASDEREFRFAWKPFGAQVLLSRIELADRPACKP